MSHNLENLFSLLNYFIVEAVARKEPLHATKQWNIAYFPDETTAENKAHQKLGESGKAKHIVSGWLITANDKIFIDQDGFEYTENEVQLIEDRKAPTATIKRLKGKLKEKEWGRVAAREYYDATELISIAKKDKKKLDPKANVRNRGTVCVPAERAKDKKDHFPINDIDQARNALARVHQYNSAPSWYSGSLKGLQSLVSSKVHSKYPSIGKEKKDKKSFENFDDLLNKFGFYAE